MRIVLGLIFIVASLAAWVFLIPGAPAETPGEVYDRYRAAMLEGRTWEEDAAFYSSAKRSAVAAQLAARDGDPETVKQMYLQITGEAASCSDLTLAEETTSTRTARLVFDVTDTCGLYGEGTKVREIIEFVLEDGWKISENTTDISG